MLFETQNLFRSRDQALPLRCCCHSCLPEGQLLGVDAEKDLKMRRQNGEELVPRLESGPGDEA
ncbi:hypothetical protein PoB_002812400 [Plakobranchus ocellatus]|uniref:Uncharacterized protein n=1 Tax=Plakobranchus ocellatus TaxID=259542 RepID=A0AAV4A5V4_9GAST|nr:hypothetical protein PoB_002812400 [Plakobranchus ocellatus]